MNIALGADHRGSDAINRLAERLRASGHAVTLHGSTGGETCDYPIAAYEVGQEVSVGRADRGVLVCGTGIGMSIAANKVDGVRAAVVNNELTAQLARSHNDANVVCMSADLLGLRLIEQIVEMFLNTEHEGGRHARRVERITSIERGISPHDDPASA
ncbi:MAG: ribose 5-phosphate isomerase B [Planctomycetota bacterium]